LLVVAIGMEVLAENLIGEDAVRHLLYGKFLLKFYTISGHNYHSCRLS